MDYFTASNEFLQGLNKGTVFPIQYNVEGSILKFGGSMGMPIPMAMVNLSDFGKGFYQLICNAETI